MLYHNPKTGAIRKPKRNDEAILQAQCTRWFKNTYPDQYGRLWMQFNNPKSQVQGQMLKAQGMISGVSDLAFIRSDGRAVFIELKTEKGRQSEEQKWWQSLIEKNKGQYHIVRSLDEFKAVIITNLNI